MDVVTPSPTAANAPAPTGWQGRFFGSRRALRNWSIANLVANCGIIVSGAVVRLTASGLGCDTWPKCSDDSYTAHPALGWHSYIEFGNRTLTFVLMAIAIATVVTAIRSRAPQREITLAWLIFAGIPFQGVIGGITVLTHLNPWVVALHLLLSVMLIAWCVKLVQQTSDGTPVAVTPRQRTLVVVLFWLMTFGLWLGTVVTGAGPHSGDHGAARNNLDIETVAKAHAWTIWVVVALTLALLAMAVQQGNIRLRSLVKWLLAAELLQGAIGYAQYFNGLPLGLVICHMIGIGLVTTAVSWVYYGTRRGLPA
ncbi:MULTISPECIES: COX15/CtaA family protein [unclassified Luteococcus]|uniref:COX15/CtaA family protein n=1 Tax=unclassified Luteococcus TaxID=2639923 RepID=UPI00313CE9D6